MEQQKRDETRWLAKVLAIVSVLLAIQLIVVQYHRISGKNLSVTTDWKYLEDIFALVGVGVALCFFWLGYRLCRCASLWTLSPWFSQTFPLFRFLEYLYFRINKHVRGGLVAGVIMLMGVFLMLYVSFLYQDLWIGKALKEVVFGIIFRPVMFVCNILDIQSNNGLLIVPMVVSYLFLAGFGIGSFMSCLASKVSRAQDSI